ncbi:MAG TPA: alpha/beta hydrolase domain-containing protein [Polyangiales bacterium]|nr:alpha/beta hydrolase domain-containing protein [Polyangiales bacterium]
MKPDLKIIHICLATFVGLFASGCSSHHDSGSSPTKEEDAAMSGDAGMGTMSDAAVDDTLTVSGPVSSGTGNPFTASAADLAGADYSEKEFFFEGEATAYALQGMTTDGKWNLMAATRAPFNSRMLVRRPIDQYIVDFNKSLASDSSVMCEGANNGPQQFVIRAALPLTRRLDARWDRAASRRCIDDGRKRSADGGRSWQRAWRSQIARCGRAHRHAERRAGRDWRGRLVLPVWQHHTVCARKTFDVVPDARRLRDEGQGICK